MRTVLQTLAATLALGSALMPTAPAFADDDGDGTPGPSPTPHHVRYVVSAAAPIYSNIYYRDTDPPTWSDYSHNPYVFSPMADVTVGPNQPWVFDTTLNDPNLWAMVTVQSGEAPNFPTPSFNCRLEVDGVLVKQNSGPHGALCSIRNW